jgi:hypothetical protein
MFWPRLLLLLLDGTCRAMVNWGICKMTKIEGVEYILNQALNGINNKNKK